MKKSILRTNLFFIFQYICVFENSLYVSLNIRQIFCRFVNIVCKKMRAIFYTLNFVLTVCKNSDMFKISYCFKSFNCFFNCI